MMRPPVIPDHHPLREAFLHDLNPHLRETLERLCCDFGELVHEAGGPFEQHHGQSNTPADLAAVVADLRFSGGFLAWHQESIDASELTPRDLALCMLAVAAAPEVLALADRLEQAFAAVTSPAVSGGVTP